MSGKDNYLNPLFF